MDRMRKHSCTLWKMIVISFSIILLSSCASHKSKKPDGPPNFYVDASKIPNAKPRPLRLSKYGNKPFYSVFGKRYQVLSSCKNYKEIGVASWYGTKFHKRATSNGERYDMLAMTAAHKNLPLPTFVEVTNLENYKKVIVKVNDRGPFSGNRIIDLSYVAAKKLDMLGRGTALVRIRAIDPATYHSRPILLAQHHKKTSITTKSICKPPHQIALADRTSSIRGLMYLQVGAFRNKANAERLRLRLLSLGAPVKISAPEHHLKLYRVQIGPIKDISTANKLTHQLLGLGIKSNKTYGV